MSELQTSDYIAILRRQTTNMSDEMNTLLDTIIDYVDELNQNHKDIVKSYEKRLNRYIDIIKHNYPEEMEKMLPYTCKEQLTEDKATSKSRYSYILHYKGKISKESIGQFYNKESKQAKDLFYGYDPARDETIVYAEYMPAKQCTGCSTFIIDDVTPYGGMPKRTEKSSCIEYVKNLSPL